MNIAISNHDESRTDDTSYSKNRHFPLDQVHCASDATNSTLYVAQNRIVFKAWYVFLVIRKQKLEVVV